MERHVKCLLPPSSLSPPLPPPRSLSPSAVVGSCLSLPPVSLPSPPIRRVSSDHFYASIITLQSSLLFLAHPLLPMSFIRPIGLRRPPAFPAFLLFLLFFIRANAMNTADEDASSASLTSSGFWLSTELLSVTFLKGCLSTALCHQPAFKLVHTMTLNGQNSAMSWPVDGGGAEMLQDGQLRQFVSHWTVGDPEDVSIGCQIAGTDPSFGFARVCDETSGRRVFQEAMVRRTVMQQQQQQQQQQNPNNNRAKRKDGGAPSPAADNGPHYPHRMVVEMRGRCFNATLAVRGHLSRCPWCPDPNVHIHVVGADGVAQTGAEGRGSDDAQQQQQLNTADSLLLLHNIVILALSGAVVFAFTGLCAVFVAQRRHRRKKQQSKASGGRRENGSKCAGMSSTLMMMRGGRREKGGKKRAKLLSAPRTQQPMPMAHQQQGDDVEGRAAATAEQTMIVYGGASRRIAGGEQQQREEEEERYDTPWDNKYCLVPRQWLFDNGSACGMAQPLPPPTAALQSAGASASHACIAAAAQFRPLAPPVVQPSSPYEHHSSAHLHGGTKYATCANFGAKLRSPMMGMLCTTVKNISNNMRTAAPGNNQSFYGAMPTDDDQQAPIGRTVPDQPPPPPPIALMAARHTQPKLIQQQQQYAHHDDSEKTTFASPNTSSGSASRHDDSGLDSV